MKKDRLSGDAAPPSRNIASTSALRSGRRTVVRT
ncbi:hypothetical protein ACVW0J_004526 [Bradyrhizobium sp. i1.7.7]